MRKSKNGGWFYPAFFVVIITKDVRLNLFRHLVRFCTGMRTHVIVNPLHVILSATKDTSMPMALFRPRGGNGFFGYRPRMTKMVSVEGGSDIRQSDEKYHMTYY